MQSTHWRDIKYTTNEKAWCGTCMVNFTTISQFVSHLRYYHSSIVALHREIYV